MAGEVCRKLILTSSCELSKKQQQQPLKFEGNKITKSLFLGTRHKMSEF